MAQYTSPKHAAYVFDGTHAEAQAFVQGLTSAQREKLVGSFITVSDRATQPIWVITLASFVPVTDVASFQDTSDTATVQLNLTDATLSANVLLDEAGAVVAGVGGLKLSHETDAFQITANALTFKADGNKAITKTASGVAVKPSTDSNNGFEFGTDGGAFVKKVSIHENSAELLAIDGDNKISVKKQLTNEIYVFEGATIDDYIASAQFATDEPSTDDKIVLTTGGVMHHVYITAKKTPTVAADFVVSEDPDVTDAHIRSRITGVNGINYVTSTGVASVKRNTVATRNDLQVDTDGVLVDIPAASFEAAGETRTLVQHIDALDTRVDDLEGVTYSNGITKTGSAVKLGGLVAEETNLTLNEKIVYKGAAIIEVENTAGLEVKSKFILTDDGGNRREQRITEHGVVYFPLL